jgi:predicted ATPase/DNA-binding winged helix-turn-helix (wHTH) protein
MPMAIATGAPAAPPAADEITADTNEEVVRFGPFTLRLAQRVLSEGDVLVKLGSRAMDILMLLLERPGEFISKEEIFGRVWPTTVVVEGNLRVHVTALRRALGDGQEGRRYILNVPNRGYSFVGPVSRGRAASPAAARPTQDPGSFGLLPLHRIVGRDAAIDSLSQQIRQHRLVTLVGPGGIGKTTVATSVAARFAKTPAASGTGVHFVDLAPLSDGRLVAGTLAAALGVLASVDDAAPNILAYLHDKSRLLLLDNCEHVLPAVAELVEAVLRSAPGVNILATSREPLRADGERVRRLQPLELPPEGSRLTAAEAVQFGAIDLFVDRVTASLDAFALEDDEVETLVELCRRLDGIPLAIELAAACVPSLGVRGILAAFEGHFHQLSAGRRTAIPRHRTIQAVLDWSYGLLSLRERAVLGRLSVFRGSFTLASASAVAIDDALTYADVLEAVTGLAEKSLLSVDASGDDTYFRLLETTRAYVSSRTAVKEKTGDLRRRHAEQMLELLRESEAAWRSADPRAWAHRYGRHVDDVRAAMTWAMSPEGDAELGMAIAVKAAPLMSFDDQATPRMGVRRGPGRR